VRYVASWSETARPHVGSSFVPQPFNQARNTLVRELERNIDRWSSVGADKEQYERVLGILRELTEPVLRHGLTWQAGWHEFRLQRESQ
jgi:hypothetical protein